MADCNLGVVAAIDFGTTYSGWAFSFKHEFEADPTKCSAKRWLGGQLMSLKGPTSVLINNDGRTVDCFGFDAESKYTEEAGNGNHKQWYYFRRFKMMLFGEIGVKKNILLEDASGRKLPALKVFSLCIGFLKDDMIKMANNGIADSGLTKNDIHWVLTVPAIWNDSAKQFMREAAEDAGINGDSLTIALEPEAASLYCRHIPTEKCLGQEKFSLAKFKEGSKYLVVDAGGGTVDVTVHEVTSTGNVRELHQASGGAWGGTKVDEAYENFLADIVGKATMVKFRNENIEDYIDLFRDFEMKKRSIDSKINITTCKIPLSLMELHQETNGKTLKQSINSTKYADQVTMRGEKLRIDADIMRGLFDKPIESIVKHVDDLLRLRSVSGCSAIVLVGGFSESPMLQDKIRKSFPRMKIIVPVEAGLAVLKGAVIFGHSPRAIAERVCKYTYGKCTSHEYSEQCDHPPTRTYQDDMGRWLCGDIFSIHVKVGQSVKLGEEQTEQTYLPVNDDQTSIGMIIYASSKRNPSLVTEPECHKIGYISVPISDTIGMRKEDRKVGVTFIFGGTEIEVKTEDKNTGRITRKRVDFLG